MNSMLDNSLVASPSYTMSSASAIACFDVAYGDEAAVVAGALIHSWDAESASQVLVRRFDISPKPYESGAFYKRELPVLLPIISEFDDPIEVIIIDGYVWLNANHLPGLGGHLFASLGGHIPVIGVAKSRYRDDTWSIPVLRGMSQRPLFVTSAGIDQERAAERIRRMHGNARIPTVLALADRAARSELT